MSEIEYYDPQEVIRLTPGPYVWKKTLNPDRSNAESPEEYMKKYLKEWSDKVGQEAIDLAKKPKGGKDQTFKADGGKINPDLLFTGMPDALKAVAAVLSYGAQKYEAHSWKRVDMARYEAALGRHMLDRKAGELYDKESGLLHLAHEACNILFLLQDYIDKASESKERLVRLALRDAYSMVQ